jgi:pimeloyl-ACP methyl ester carboxylesterase
MTDVQHRLSGCGVGPSAGHQLVTWHAAKGHFNMVISLDLEQARVPSPVIPGTTSESGAAPAGPPAPAADGVRFATIGGLRIRYKTTGKGTPLLLLHGWGTSLDTFRHMAEDLGRFHAVTSFDFPGHGESDLPPVGWAVDDFVALTLNLMSELGIERASMLGHSFGGRVAIKLAAAHPDKVDRLVLVDAAGVPPAQTIRRRLKRFLSRFANSVGRLGSPGQAIRRKIVTRIASPDYLNAGPLRGTFLAVIKEDLRPVMPLIQASTFLIWGDLDEDTPPSDARTMERLIPGAKLLVIKSAGHFSYLDQYGRFRLAVMPFLND